MTAPHPELVVFSAVRRSPNPDLPLPTSFSTFVETPYEALVKYDRCQARMSSVWIRAFR